MRDRGSGYVESPQRLEREFQKALERTRAVLEQQRARIKRAAKLRRVAADRGGQKQCCSSHAKNVSLVRSAGA